MNIKNFIAKAAALIVLFAFSTSIQAQDSCCKKPDSLRVVSVTSTQFCVSWIIKPVTPPCDSVVSSTIHYRKVGIDIWTTQTITLSHGQQSVLFCAAASPCTQYEWEVKNDCKRGDSVIVSSAWVSGPNFTTPCDTASCCNTPDSLKVVSLSANQFCVSWKVKDSSACDSALGAELQFRPVGGKFWKTATITYTPGVTTYIYCDSILPCTSYEWRVRTICIKKGIISYSAYVYGPGFTSTCKASGKLQSFLQNQLEINVTPNPASGQVRVQLNKSTGSDILCTISDASGKIYVQQRKMQQQKTTDIVLDVSKLLPGIYFIKLVTKSESVVRSFIKE